MHLRLAALRLLLGLGLLAALPALAAACPTCAGNDDGGLARTAFVGAMIAFPFLLVGLVVPVLRKSVSFGGSSEEGDERLPDLHEAE